MAAEIAAMSEVEAYHFVSKRETLDRFRDRFAEKIVANLPFNPLPATFEILVRDRANVVPVARRFYDNPVVDNDPGTHNGVKRAADELPTASPDP